MITAQQAREKANQHKEKSLFKTQKKKDKYILRLLDTIEFQICEDCGKGKFETTVWLVAEHPFLKLKKIQECMDSIVEILENLGYEICISEYYPTLLEIKWDKVN